MDDHSAADGERGTGREEILAVARRLFMTRGYRAVSTREIAQAVGVTQPALYHHFGGKEALYAEVVLAQVDDYAVAIDAAVSLDVPAADRLEAISVAFAERAEHDLTLMFHDLRYEMSPETRKRIGTAFWQRMVAPMRPVLAELEREGAIAWPVGGGRSPFEQERFVLGVIRTLTEGPERDGAQPGRTPAEIGAEVRRLVLHGLGPPGAQTPSQTDSG